MFENVLKGTKVKKSGAMKVFGSKEANRWKKEGSVGNMVNFRGYKKNKWWK